MRSNPFAITFGKKTEERRDDASSPQPGYGRLLRGYGTRETAPRRHEDAAGAPPARPAADRASASCDAPIDADTMAALRSWGLPDAKAPAAPHGPEIDAPGSAPDPGPPGTAADDVSAAAGAPGAADRDPPLADSDPASSGAGTAIDRLRAELGADDRDAG